MYRYPDVTNTNAALVEQVLHARGGVAVAVAGYVGDTVTRYIIICRTAGMSSGSPPEPGAQLCQR